MAKKNLNPTIIYFILSLCTYMDLESMNIYVSIILIRIKMMDT